MGGDVRDDEYDVVIVGAGTAGCITALELSKYQTVLQCSPLSSSKSSSSVSSSSGPLAVRPLRICVLERDWSKPQRIVGELLQPRAIDLLRDLQLLEYALHPAVDAVPCFGYTIYNPHIQNNGSNDGKATTGDSILLRYHSRRPVGFWERLGMVGNTPSKEDENNHLLKHDDDHEVVDIQPPTNGLTEEFLQSCKSILGVGNQKYTSGQPQHGTTNYHPPHLLDRETTTSSTVTTCGDGNGTHATNAAAHNTNITGSTPICVGTASTVDSLQSAFDGGGAEKKEETTPVPSSPLPRPVSLCMHNGRLLQLLRAQLATRHNIHLLHGSAVEFIIQEGIGNKQSAKKRTVKGVTYKPIHSTSSHPKTAPPSSSISVVSCPNSSSPPLGSSSSLLTVRSSLTLLCDGFQNPSLCRVYSSSRPALLCTWIGLLLIHPPGRAPMPNHGFACVVLARPSPVLIYQISLVHTRMLVCIDDKEKIPKEQTGQGKEGFYEHYLLEILAPQLPEDVRDLFIQTVRGNIHRIEKCNRTSSAPNHCSTTTASTMPGHNTNSSHSLASCADSLEPVMVLKNNYYMPAGGAQISGLLAVGDAFNMRHALTGGGITVLLSDVKLLTQLLREADLADTDQLVRVAQMFHSRRRKYAGTINTLASTLYDVFSTPPSKWRQRTHLAQECYRYLGSGGAKTNGPVGLLSGLVSSPGVLVLHFFYVVWGAGRASLSKFTWATVAADLRQFYQVLREGVGIVMPLLVQERITFLRWWPFRRCINLIFPWE